MVAVNMFDMHENLPIWSKYTMTERTIAAASPAIDAKNAILKSLSSLPDIYSPFHSKTIERTIITNNAIEATGKISITAVGRDFTAPETSVPDAVAKIEKAL
jgi:hypothetical protein